MKPLVSILIPAYNSEKWLAYTLQSAVAQTWERKEIIVVDDGSTDRTAEMARRFASKEVKVVSTANGGLSAAVNHAFQLCQGDYIQELDSDDLLSPDKIERQLAALREGDSKRILLSSPWAYFYYRTSHARFIPNSLWHDLSPVEWLLRKMGKNLNMAGEPGTGRGGRALGHTPSVRSRRRIFFSCGHDIRRHSFRTRSQSILQSLGLKSRELHWQFG
jgi:glycosyltransferase involved in cell wall biosynthesis